MSSHEVGISDYFLREKSSNGEFYFQNGENWVFSGFLSRQISKKKSKNIIKFCKRNTKFY
jgi:hypothetical protein